MWKNWEPRQPALTRNQVTDSVRYASLLDLLNDRSYPVGREQLAPDHLEPEDGGARRGPAEADVLEALLKDHVPQEAGAVVRRLPCHRMLQNDNFKLAKFFICKVKNNWDNI